MVLFLPLFRPSSPYEFYNPIWKILLLKGISVKDHRRLLICWKLQNHDPVKAEKEIVFPNSHRFPWFQVYPRLKFILIDSFRSLYLDTFTQLLYISTGLLIAEYLNAGRNMLFHIFGMKNVKKEKCGKKTCFLVLHANAGRGVPLCAL